MEFINETLDAAWLGRATASDDGSRMLAWVLMETQAHGAADLAGDVVRARAARARLERKRPRRRLDVTVRGTFRPPRAVSAADLVVRVGTLERRLRVTGDRVWSRTPSGMAASAPKPFEEMSLGWDRAFGGIGRVYELPFHHPTNPVGRGYAVLDDAAIGQPLPNLEDPSRPTQSPQSVQDPWCFAPLAGPALFEADRDALAAGHPVDHALEQRAHPSLRFDRRNDAWTLGVEGIRAPMSIDVPAPAYAAYVSARSVAAPTALPLLLEAVDVDLDERSATFTWSVWFTYSVYARETRLCRLVRAPGGAG